MEFESRLYKRIATYIILIVLAMVAGTSCILPRYTNNGNTGTSCKAMDIWEGLFGMENVLGLEGEWRNELGECVDDSLLLMGESGIEGLSYAHSDYNAEIYEYVGTTAEYTPINVAVSSDGSRIIIKAGNSKVKRFSTNKTIKTKYNVFLHEYAKSKFARGGTLQQKRQMLKLIKSQGFGAEDALRYIFGALTYDIDRWLVLNADNAPLDARISFCPDNEVKFRIIKERSGFYVDREQIFQAVLESYLNAKDVSVNAVRHEIKPLITATQLRLQTHYRAGFSTSYASSSEARKHNVRLALSKYNGYVLGPGKSLSFNKIVGARTAENGYLDSKIIINGRFEDGLGGGVCQSSTTMYNAALLAGMTITEARQHSLRVGYIEPSFDAMVSGGGSDLVFRNDTERPVYIRTYSNDSRVYAEFYGLKMPYIIKRRSETIKVIPCKETEIIPDIKGEYTEFVKYKGDRHYLNYPKDGLESKGYLRYYQDGKLIKEEHIRTDKYSPLKGRIVEGVLERPVDILYPQGGVESDILPPKEEQDIA